MYSSILYGLSDFHFFLYFISVSQTSLPHLGVCLRLWDERLCIIRQIFDRVIRFRQWPPRFGLPLFIRCLRPLLFKYTQAHAQIFLNDPYRYEKLTGVMETADLHV